MSALKALIVEDNPSDAELLILELKRGGFQVQSKRVDTPQAYKAALEETTGWDIIFSDHSMPHFSSFEALKILNQKALDIPFIILSGTMGEDLAVDAMRAGADDYFVKGKLTRLNAAVNRELQEAKERQGRRASEWELEHFVTSLTHDLRTPILAERRVLTSLNDGAFGPLTPEQHEVLNELIQSNSFVQHMVNNILYAYKYKQHAIHLNPVPTELGFFIEKLVNSNGIQALLQEKDLHLLVQPSDTIPPVTIDPPEIQRVLLNLIKNAADHSPKGSAIHISLEWQSGFVRVSVEDSGSGVDPDMEPLLFKPYITSATKKFRPLGMGLGLYLCKYIIEAHGGSIGYMREDPGSVFYFTLPAATPQAMVSADAASSARQPASSL